MKQVLPSHARHNGIRVDLKCSHLLTLRCFLLGLIVGACMLYYCNRTLKTIPFPFVAQDILPSDYGGHVTTLANQSNSYREHVTAPSNPNSSYRRHVTTMTNQNSSYRGNMVTPSSQNNSYRSHLTTLTNQNSSYRGHATTQINSQSSTTRIDSFSIRRNDTSHLLSSWTKKFDENFRLFRVKELKCENIFTGAKYDVKLGINISKQMAENKELLTPSFYKQNTQNCSWFRISRGYIMSSLSQEEEMFPLAYSILVFKDIEPVERLLRAIYRPQNVYCIHVDNKAESDFFQAVKSISDCFQNVHVVTRRVDVRWGTFSVLEPEIICMEHLWGHKSWKYFINLTGQEFPLKTNFELVKILTAFQGANDVSGTVKRANKHRWGTIPPPGGLRPTKGSVHVALNRQTVDFILHHPIGQAFLNWTRSTEVPDETFFSTLNHNPQLGIPGTYLGEPETTKFEPKPFLIRFKNWGGHPHDYPCASAQWVRSICILGTGDLPFLGTRREMFANKFYLHEDRIAIGCLEELLYNRTRAEYLGLTTFNTSLYENVGFVKNQVKVNEIAT